MKLTSILSPRKRKRAYNRAIKKFKWVFSEKTGNPIPVFVFGKQRSGTTMFMDIMENRSDTEVFQEWAPSIFSDCQIRSFTAVEQAIAQSRADFVCFKPICDSHRIKEFIELFPDARVIWVVRDYLDNSNSAIRRFAESDRAIRLVCEEQPGGGWLAEGVSRDALETLKSAYRPDISKFELSCLTWWLRNNIIIEAKLSNNDQFFLVKYENLVREPQKIFQSIEARLSISTDDRSYSDVHTRSVAKNEFPDISPEVRRICDELTQKLNTIADAQNQG